MTDPDTDQIADGGLLDNGSSADTSNYDCRYKPLEPCQGRKLEESTDSQKEQCRQIIDPICFKSTYETYWALDFWSFVFLIPAIFGCVFEEDFTYGLCVGNSAYVLNLKYLQDELGIRF